METKNRITLVKLDFAQLGDIAAVQCFLAMAYNKTGHKFSLSWHGSKGYLSHMEIAAEGYQTADTNRIFCDKLFTRARTWRKKQLIVSYCRQTGVHLETA
jgi:hypothetical protein